MLQEDNKVYKYTDSAWDAFASSHYRSPSFTWSIMIVFIKRVLTFFKVNELRCSPMPLKALVKFSESEQGAKCNLFIIFLEKGSFLLFRP